MKNAASRIVGGKATTAHKYPWVVGLKISNSKINCAGSIINKYWILTAASCING